MFMHTVEINKGKGTLTLGPRANGAYPVLACSLTTAECPVVVISPEGCDSSVTNLDTRSDWAQCFALSTHVEVDGCVVTPSELHAKNLDILQVALRKVKFVSVNPDEI